MGRTRDIKQFILDEADEMLSRGFKDQIYDVFRHLNQDIQVILLSATMPEEVLEVTSRFMREPIRILVKKEELTLEVSASFTFLSRGRSGNSTRSATCTRPSPSRRQSSSPTPGGRWTGSQRRCTSETSPCRPCTGTWTRRSVTSS